MGTLVLFAGTAAVGASAVLAASCLRLRSAVGFLLAVYLLASLEIVAVSLLLSIGHHLTRSALVAALGTVLALSMVAWARLGRPSPPVGPTTLRSIADALRDPVVAVLAAVAVFAHLYLLVVSLTVPQSLPDTMLYHLPRAALWKQQHFVGYVANVPDERVNGFSPGAEIETMASMVMSGGDRFVALVQLAALVVLCVSIAGIARRLRLGCAAAAFGALAFATFTVVLLQTPTALNDLVVAAALSTCAYFAMGRTRTEIVLAAAALVLALGTKLTAVFALPALALFVLAGQPRRRWPAVLFAGVAGAAVGSFWLLLNLVETGRLGGGATLDRGNVGPLGRVRLSLLDLFELSDVDGKRLLASVVPGLVVLAVGLAVAMAFSARRRWGWAATVGLAGVFAALALPMLIVWARVADHGFAQVRAALGLASVPAGPRLPTGYHESAMHSSYGLAFVLLLLGASALAVIAVVREELPVAALFALAAVPVTVVLFALALAPDPQRMRYVVFPVALAAAVFGVALRVRPLAWAAVALAAASVVVTLGYFVPRPAGLALLPGHGGLNATARWFVQGGSGGGDPAAFRFLEHSVPADTTIALSVLRNTYLYPAWDAGLRRRVLFTTPDGRIPPQARWLVVGPGKSLESTPPGWTRVFASHGGWRIYRRG